jgi:hypothetical protein
MIYVSQNLKVNITKKVKYKPHVLFTHYIICTNAQIVIMLIFARQQLQLEFRAIFLAFRSVNFFKLCIKHQNFKKFYKTDFLILICYSSNNHKSLEKKNPKN